MLLVWVFWGAFESVFGVVAVCLSVGCIFKVFR